MDHRRREEKLLLSCSICLELLKEPKMLSCQHRFCESCLNKLITASAAEGSIELYGFSCPDCGTFTQPPTDWRMKTRTELYISRQELQEHAQPHTTQPCPKHTNTEVTLYCTDCSLPVCHLCVAASHQSCNRLVTMIKIARDRSLLNEKISQIQQAIEKL